MDQQDRPDIPIAEVGRVEEPTAPTLAEAIGAPLRSEIRERQRWRGGLEVFEREAQRLRSVNRRRTYRAVRKV
jgi:hypothetical protein